MRISRLAKWIGASALAALLVFPVAVPKLSSIAQAAEYVTIGTGGITGVYYPVGGAISRLVNKGSKQHGIRATVESTGASVFNVNAIRSGDLSMGIVQTDTQYYAYTGTGPEQFVKAGPDTKMRALFSLYAEAFTVMARDDANISTFKDLAGKRVNIGDPGSGNRSTMELLMKEYGWTEDTFKIATDLKPAEMAGALRDDKIAASIYVVGHPNASFKEASSTCESHIVPVEGPEVDAFVEKHNFFPRATVPGGLYKGTDNNVPTFGPKASLLTSSDLPDEVAYQVVKAVFENLDEFKKLHPVLENITPEEMLQGNTAPFHPGAVRYFKEVGLMQ